MAGNFVAKSDDSYNEAVKPKRISTATWERFQALKNRTDAVTKRSTEKRIKHLQRTILQNVEEKFTSEDKAMLKEFGVTLDSEASESKNTVDDTGTAVKSLLGKSKTDSSKKFQEVEKYLGINDHLRQGASISCGPVSRLEKQVEDAIASGDITTAEKLSDRLAARDFGVKVSEAIAARDYTKRKKEEEEAETLRRKKKKLHWGFEHKQRWETKSNM